MTELTTYLLKRIDNQANMEKIIDLLRQYHFVFMETEYLYNNLDGIKISPKHRDYQWMVLEKKPAIVGKKGEYDKELILGFNLRVKRDWIRVYINGKIFKSITKPWRDKEDINFRKIKITLKFPDEMEDYAERRKWRSENKKVQRNPNYQPSEFYKKWKDKVKIIAG